MQQFGDKFWELLCNIFSGIFQVGLEVFESEGNQNPNMDCVIIIIIIISIFAAARRWLVDGWEGSWDLIPWHLYKWGREKTCFKKSYTKFNVSNGVYFTNLNYIHLNFMWVET